MINICSDFIEDIKTTYNCARICTNVPTAPISDYIISEFNLISTSIFYADEKFYKWQVYDGEFLLYDSGWGGEGELIGDFSNGSTFDNIYLGMNNIDIINLLYSMRFYIKKRTLSIAHSVMDENNKISKKTIKYFLNETD